MMHWLHSEDAPPDAIVAMIKEVESGSDRAAAILAASCVEDQLAFAIKCKLRRDDESVIRDMFQVRGPLGSFSAKISMGYLLGLYDKETRKELDTIKEIRNTFAHRAYACHFETQRIRDLASNLSLSQRFEIYTPPHAPVTDMKTGDMVILAFGMRSTAEPEIGEPCLPRIAPDGTLSPRERFVRACKYHLHVLGISGMLVSGVARRGEYPS